MHPSQAPPAHTNTLGLLRRLGVRVSQLVVDPQASHTVSVKVRLNALWFISGLVGLFVRPVSLVYKSVSSCLFFRTCQSRSVCRYVWVAGVGLRVGSARGHGSHLIASGRLVASVRSWLHLFASGRNGA